MIWLFYNCLFPIAYLALLPRFLWRMGRRGGYRRGFLQRLGFYDRKLRERLQMRRRIWIHAVSVGEIFVALRFIEALRARQGKAAFILTTNTSTGHAIAKKQIGSDDLLLYFPVDFPLIINLVLKRLKPLALILVESELWPNLIRQTKTQGIPLMLLNGRLSDRSYRRYRKVRWLTQQLFPLLDLLCVQGHDEQARLIELGADPARVHVVGSAKYDVATSSANISMPSELLKQRAGFSAGAALLVGGSTWPGEETALLTIYQRLRAIHSEARLVLVPRHAERADEIASAIEQYGLRYQRWSASAPAGVDAEVLLVDTTGDLKHFYAAAKLIFVGKSLLSHGGQNVIEAAVFAKPIIVGPHMENFRLVMADFLSVQALLQVPDQAALEQAILELWSKAEQCQEYGRRAQELVRQKAGAIQASVDLFLMLAKNLSDLQPRVE